VLDPFLTLETMCLKCSLVKFVVVSHVAGTHSAPLRFASLVPFLTLEVLFLDTLYVRDLNFTQAEIMRVDQWLRAT